MDSIAFTFEEDPFPDILKDLDSFETPLHFSDLTTDQISQEIVVPHPDHHPHETTAPPAANDPPYFPANQDGGDDKEGQKGNKKQKLTKHREVERERRKGMASLHESLRTLLPLEYIKGKRSMSDHLEGAAKYIINLKASNQVMMGKMNKLKAARIRSLTTSADGDQVKDSSGLSIDNGTRCSDPYCDQVVVKASKEGVEVLVRVRQGRALSRVLRSVAQEGLEVTSCLTTRLLDYQFLHCIQSKVRDGRDIDTNLLAAKLSANKYWT